MSTDQILKNALNAAADVAEVIHGHEVGDAYRKFADTCYSAEHELLTPQTCNITHYEDRQCPVCDGRLTVCRKCGEYEAGLDNPCKGLPETPERATRAD